MWNAGRRQKEGARGQNCCATHEMIPNAWYSMIEERDIRAMRPCCMPRSNRKIATFGDGCRERREAESDPENRGAMPDLCTSTHHLDINLDLSHGEPWDQDAGEDPDEHVSELDTEIPEFGVKDDVERTYNTVMPNANQKSC